jgi:hypothetical protein
MKMIRLAAGVVGKIIGSRRGMDIATSFIAFSLSPLRFILNQNFRFNMNYAQIM